MVKRHPYPLFKSASLVRKAFCLFLAVVALSWIPVPLLADSNSKFNHDDFDDTPTPTPIPTSAAPAEYPKVVIGPGDELSIQVYGEDALASIYQVDSNGIIKFPYVGRIKLVGLTAVEASDLLDRLMQKPKHTTVIITKSNTFWVSVLGDVGGPGKFEIRGAPTLPSILAQAGGPKPDANLDKALLVHGRVKKKVKLRNWLRDEGDTGPPIYMYPGDSLVVYRADRPANIGDVAQVVFLALGVFALGFATDRALK